MPEILEIIHDLTYQVNSTGLDKALEKIQLQVKNIDVLTAALKRQQAAFDATTDTKKREALNASINNTKKRIEGATVALTDYISKNKVLNDAIQKEIGLIGGLQSQLTRLKDARSKALSVEDIRKYNKEIESAERSLSKLTGAGSNGGAFGKIGSGLLQGFGIGAGFSVLTRLSEEMGEFISDSIHAAIEVEGVERAFSNLNKPDLLNNLRSATQGTVSDLELMKQAVQFNNFQLPLEKLGGLLAFARIRARDTGQEMSKVLNDLISGIARQSPRILDNLGLSQVRIRKEFELTGDFAQAAFKIIDEEAAKAGDSMLIMADKADKVAARFANFKSAVGKSFLEGIDFFTNPDYYKGILNNPLLNPIGTLADVSMQKLAIEKQKEIQATLLQNVEGYIERYKNTDAHGREQMLSQAREYNDKLRQAEERSQAAGLIGVASYYRQMQALFGRFISGVNPTVSFADKLNKDPKSVTAADLDNASRDQLEEGLSKLKEKYNPLTVKDKALSKEYTDLYDEIQGRIDKIDGKVVKAHTKSVNARINLEKELQKKIADLQAEGEQLRLKNEVESTEKIAKEVDIRYNKEIQELQAQEKAAKLRGELTEKSKEYFAQIRDLYDQNALLDFQNRNGAFRVGQIGQQRDFATGRLQAELEALKGAAGLPGGNSLNNLRRQAQLETQIATDEAEKKYSKLFDDAKRNGEDLAKLAQEREDALLLIQEQGNRKQLEAEEKYLEAVISQLKEFENLIVAQYREIADAEKREIDNGFGSYNDKSLAKRKAEINAQLEANKELQKSTYKAIDDAHASYQRISADANRTQKDLDNAELRISKERENLQKLKDDAKEAKHELRSITAEQISRIADVYSSITQAAVQYYNMVADAQMASLNREIQIREMRIAQATKIAERGNVELLRIEQDRLNKSLQQREAAARKQQSINAALAVSEAIVGVVKAAAEGDPYTTIARVIAFIAALAAGYAAVSASTNEAATSQGFYKGGYTGDGGKYEPAGSVHKGEFVIDKEKTALHRPILEAMHKGSPLPILNTDAINGGNGFATKGELKELGKKMDRVVEAIENSHVSVKQSMDAQGLHQVVEKFEAKEKRRQSI